MTTTTSLTTRRLPPQGRRSATRLYDQFGKVVKEFAPIRERMVDTDNGFAFVKTQTVDAVFDAVASIEAPRRPKGDGVRYIGSVPILVNQIWAKECGAPMGSKEFLQYAHKQLKDGEYSKFHAWLR